MASAPSEPRPVLGRVDKAGRLIAADPELEELQREAGSELGQTLALPQVAAVAQLARKLGTAVSRPGDRGLGRQRYRVVGPRHARRRRDRLVARRLDGRAPQRAAARGAFLAAEAKSRPRRRATNGRPTRSFGSSRFRPTLPNCSASMSQKAAGAPLTRILRLEEDDDGDMPLISALAARRGFYRPARPQPPDESRSVVLERRGRHRGRRRVSPASAARREAIRRRCQASARARAPSSTMRSMRCCARRSTGSSKARNGSSRAPTGRCAAIMRATATTLRRPRGTAVGRSRR